MTDPIDPMRPLPHLRPDRHARSGRDKDEGNKDRRDGDGRPKSNLPMVIPPPEGEEAERAVGPKPAGPATAPFAAQVMGQGGIRRGLRGGQEVLDNARATYLETEYSGPNDRRPPKGLLKKTEI